MIEIGENLAGTICVIAFLVCSVLSIKIVCNAIYGNPGRKKKETKEGASDSETPESTGS